MEAYQRIVFCDFDGTITEEETFLGVLRCFAGTDFDTTERQLVSRAITIREGVRRLVQSIPSAHYPQMLDYVRDRQMRAGLPELLDFLEAEAVPFVIISGGLLGLVLARVESLAARIHAVHAADVDTSGEYLRVVSAFEEDPELVAKARVMSRYRYEEAVAIGDGMTDINMAIHSSIVFARNGLRRHLEAKGKPFRTWDDFFDVLHTLQGLWNREA